MPDEIDRRLIVATQAGLPLVPRPWQALADRLGIPAAEVQARLAAMLASGVVRRIGAVPNHYALGYRFNGMTVWDVDDARVDALGMAVGALPFVSHCYRRPRRLPEWPYNLFAMVHARSREAALEQVERIAAVLGSDCRGRDVLFSSRILKKTGLRLTDG
ncbi:MAG: Lrp/AsnC family transcriptional regulator [Rhodocyclaceae bacterium]|jgi:DNA-binding Lrp family transcriptional regulator|nr:Lrp/AsnC family transcriptional regulator [Rhodocyclaceae bacterium]